MKRLYKVHKRAKGFTWVTLCGIFAPTLPTDVVKDVTCKTCKRLIEQGKG